MHNAAREEYEPEDESSNKDEVDKWLDSLLGDAEFNLTSYADCFLSENLVRKYIEKNKIKLKNNTKKEADQWRAREAKKKGKANLSFEIRKDESDIFYLGMDDLAVTVEGSKNSAGSQSLCDDAIAYAPVRNVIGHTGQLTKNGKDHLRLRYENIKARLKSLLAQQ